MVQARTQINALVANPFAEHGDFAARFH